MSGSRSRAVAMTGAQRPRSILRPDLTPDRTRIRGASIALGQLPPSNSTPSPSFHAPIDETRDRSAGLPPPFRGSISLTAAESRPSFLEEHGASPAGARSGGVDERAGAARSKARSAREPRRARSGSTLRVRLRPSASFVSGSRPVRQSDEPFETSPGGRLTAATRFVSITLRCHLGPRVRQPPPARAHWPSATGRARGGDYRSQSSPAMVAQVEQPSLRTSRVRLRLRRADCMSRTAWLLVGAAVSAGCGDSKSGASSSAPGSSAPALSNSAKPAMSALPAVFHRRHASAERQCRVYCEAPDGSARFRAN